jgi:NDP-sugar pyrophosphorylase family protein
MQAVILAGGKGTRLAPYTTILPKPLMPVGQVPILELIIRQLRHAGFDRIEIATGHLAGLIEAYFGDGSRWNVQLRYHVENEPAGTAGPLYLLREVLDDDFVVMNGDVLTDLDYAALFDAHHAGGALLTIATCMRDVVLSLGAIVRDDAGRICDYVEKPTYQFECSAGIYAAKRHIVDELADTLPVDFPTLVRKLIAKDAHLQAFPIPGFWLDIGTPDDYKRANDEFAERFARWL